MKTDELAQFLGSCDMSVVNAMEMIDRNASGILFLVDTAHCLIGCVTDGDIRRWLIKTGNLSASVSNCMKHNPISVPQKSRKEAYVLIRQYRISAVPILGTNREVIDVVLREESEESLKRKPSLAGIPVVIMAGGKGTRLYPYTKILPKPLIPIGDTPIVERIMNYYTDYNIHEFYMTVNYKKDMIRSYFSEGKFPFIIKYVEERIPLGTGGSLRLIEDRFNKPIFVTNCDALILADYDNIYRYHCENQHAITMVAAVKNITIPYGVLHTGENGELLDMEEKPTLSHMINTGMYVINPELIDLIPENCVFHMTYLVEKVRESGLKVGVYPVSEDSFLDMGEFDEMNRMEEKLNIGS